MHFLSLVCSSSEGSWNGMDFQYEMLLVCQNKIIQIKSLNKCHRSVTFNMADQAENFIKVQISPATFWLNWRGHRAISLLCNSDRLGHSASLQYRSLWLVVPSGLHIEYQFISWNSASEFSSYQSALDFWSIEFDELFYLLWIWFLLPV